MSSPSPSSSPSSSTLAKKMASFHLGPIPYDAEPPRWNVSAESTRMVRGVEGDINGNMTTNKREDGGKLTLNGQKNSPKLPTCSSMPSFNVVGDTDRRQEIVRTPSVEEGPQVASQVPRSQSIVMHKEHMGPVEYSQPQNAIKRTSPKLPPPGTIFHEVTSGQSLDSIALLYDSMPSYLLKLNKRTSRVVFAGEVILVPDKNNLDLLTPPSETIMSKPKSANNALNDGAAKKTNNKSDTTSFSQNNKPNPMDLTLRGQKPDASHLPMEEDKENASAGVSVADLIAEGWAGFRKKKPPTLERQVRRPRPLTRAESIQINKQCAENFLKIQVTQILPNKEQIEGTLLITPNAVMFETQLAEKQNGKTSPSSDLIIPMRLISGASMFSDLSSFASLSEKKGFTSVELKSLSQEQLKMGASSSVAATSPTGSKPSSTSPKTEAETCGSPRGADHTPNSVNSQSTLAKFFGAVEDWLLGSYGLFEIAPGSWMMIHQLPEFLGFTGDGKGSLGYEAATCFEELPLYLRILLFDPTTVTLRPEKPGAPGRERKVTGPQQSQYWFKLPAEWVDKVYAFFVQWTPDDAAGASEESGADERNAFVMVTSDEGLDSGLENENEGEGEGEGPGTDAQKLQPMGAEDMEASMTSSMKSRKTTVMSTDSFWADQSLSRKYTKEWEILHHDEYSRRQRRLLEQTLPMPEIQGESLIMTVAHVRKMMPNLPSRCMGSVWCCMYNSTLDGLSINTLYRKCKSPHLDSGICCMLIIEPREKRRKNSTAPQSPSTSTLTSQGTSKSASDSFDEPSVQHANAAQPQSNLPTEGVKDLFGAVLSNPPTCREGFYGNGQTFVFKFTRRPGKAIPSSLQVKKILSETMHQSAAETNKDLDMWKLECYNWAGSNNLFISCGNDHITVGGDNYNAKPALTIDADLTRGQTFECQTFDSPKLTANNESAFEISAIELWAFIPENCFDQMSFEISGRILDL